MSARTLLIMSCGATKDESAEWMAADRRYTGPLWQTLRASCHLQPDTGIAVLSARYGLITGSTMIQKYNARMTPSIAARMIEEGGDALWPKAPPGVNQVTFGNRANCEIMSLSRHGDAPFDRVVLCGGKLYIQVMKALIGDISKATPAFTFDVDIEVICGPIGKMRQALARAFPEPMPVTAGDDDEPLPDSRPWETDKALRLKLESIGLRYAAMIGLVAEDDAEGHEVAERDRAAYPDFIRRDAMGRPIFSDADAVAFLAATSQQPDAVCRAWLRHDWPL